MRLIYCDYCESSFYSSHSNIKYCPNKNCKDKATKIKKRIRQKKTHNTIEPRTCKRCLCSMQFHGMKKYCQNCLKLLKKKPHLYRKEMTMIQLCERCKEKPKKNDNKSTKYCEECAVITNKEKMDEHNRKVTEETKRIKELNEKNGPKKINPFFLRRKKD